MDLSKLSKFTAAFIVALFLIGGAVAPSCAQNLITPVTMADIQGDGAVHAVSSTGTARWITFVSASSNSTVTCGTSSIAGCVRVGDSNISTTRGTPLTPGLSAYVPESAGTSRHSLNQWFYLVQSGDKITITYGL